jgi:PEGA domain
MCKICTTAILLALFGLTAGRTSAQATTEASTMVSSSALSAQAADDTSLEAPIASDFGTFNIDILADPPRHSTESKGGAGPNLIAPVGPPPDVANRKQFEENAGRQGGKLLLRSVPSGAEIFINHLFVGHTPLLMFIAPGKYDIDMRGSREDSGHRTVGVVPKETQSVVIDLNQRYPSSVSIRW